MSSGLGLRDPHLAPIADKVLEGRRLSRAEGLTLAESQDLLGLGRLATVVRRRLHRNLAFFNINRHLNPTNVCTGGCNLCAFSVPFTRREEGWTYSVEEAVGLAVSSVDRAVTELHVVGGLNPALGLEYYESLFAALRRELPWVHIKALTMVELDFLASLARAPVPEVIDRLHRSGLGSCPGGGAEIFSPRVRRLICPSKISGERWLEVARAVHEAGLRSNCTMLYGHVETVEERVDHLLALRSLQDETGGFQCFVPLAFHPHNTTFDHLPPTGGVLDLQTMALSRLLLDNVAHLKAYWVMLGEKLAQMALHFGADDLDGTVVDERITRSAGGTAGAGISRTRLERLVTEARHIPVLRDSLYRPVTAAPPGAEPPEYPLSPPEGGSGPG